jgi:Uri superfamily endonuclease
VLESKQRESAQIGKWGKLEISRGHYLYVGSAFGPGGLLSRVSRHCREEKSKRWHIDFLRECTSVKVVWYRHGSVRLEHRWAKALEAAAETTLVKGFGCSDCHCAAHLFYVAKASDLSVCANALPEGAEQWSCVSGD